MLLPHPDSPTKATFLPGSKTKSKFSSIGLWFLSLGYMNFIFLNSIFPLTESLFGFIFLSEIKILGTLSYKVK